MKSSTLLQIIFFFLCFSLTANTSDNSQRKKILYIDSYNANIWSASIQRGIHSILDNHPEIELHTFHMDTKKSDSEAHIEKAALKAKKIIEEWRPDIVLFSDDNAAKYLVVPYFMNSDIPFIFGGINNNASQYNFPPENITGIVEVIPLADTYNILKPYLKGSRIGFIGCDNVTSHTTYDYLTGSENMKFAATRFAKNFAELKEAFIELQSQVDALQLYDTYSVDGFNVEEMIDFAHKHTIIPTFGSSYTTILHTLLGTPKIGEEQGEWMANTALEVLKGKKIKDIPITKNKRAKIYLNLPIAKILGIKFPIELLDSSYLIVKKPGRILYMDLYYPNSSLLQNNSEIKKGLLLSLNIQQVAPDIFDNTQSEVELKLFHEDIENNSDLTYILKLKQNFLRVMREYNPEVIITTYNNTVQLLLNQISPEFNTPIIICGLDWDIFFKNTLHKNIIVQKNFQLLKKAINLAYQYSSGKKVGYIALNSQNANLSLQELVKKTGIKFSLGELVDTWDSLQKSFLKLQKRVDVICFFEICKVRDWDNEEARKFFADNTTIPTIAFSSLSNNFALIYIKQLALEQGWVAGKTALSIIFPDEEPQIPDSIYKSSTLNINPEILKHLQFNNKISSNTAIR